MVNFVISRRTWKVGLFRLGILTGGFSLLLKVVLDLMPAKADDWYGGIYAYIAPILRGMTYWVPFPVYYVFWPVMVVLILYYLFRSGRLLLSRQWSAMLKMGIIPVLGIFGWILGCFYVLWGYNYCRPSWSERMNMSSMSVDSAVIWTEWQWVKKEIQRYADSTPVVKARLAEHFYDEATEAELNHQCKKVLSEFIGQPKGEVKVRKLVPGTLLHLSTAGFYLPFTGEANLDAGLYELQWPFVAAHEIFHGFGITDEGDCNFLALLACLNSSDPVITYSALEAYWKELAILVKYRFGERYFRELEEFPTSFHRDLQTIFAYQDRYKDILPDVRHFIYNNYLRSQGVTAGLASYNQVVALMNHYRHRAEPRR